MSDQINVFVDASAGPARLDAAYLDFQARLLSVAGALESDLFTTAQARARTALQTHTGAFVDSLRGWLKLEDDGVSGGVVTDAPEAGILEWGGQTRAHDILPNVAEALAFNGGAAFIFAKIVHDPGAHIADHSVLRTALADQENAIVAGMTDVGKQFGR